MRFFKSTFAFLKSHRRKLLWIGIPTVVALAATYWLLGYLCTETRFSYCERCGIGIEETRLGPVNSESGEVEPWRKTRTDTITAVSDFFKVQNCEHPKIFIWDNIYPRNLLGQEVVFVHEAYVEWRSMHRLFFSIPDLGWRLDILVKTVPDLRERIRAEILDTSELDRLHERFAKPYREGDTNKANVVWAEILQWESQRAASIRRWIIRFLEIDVTAEHAKRSK